MHVNIKTIPHEQQRYPTVGDWWFDEAGDLQIRVSDLGANDYESLVMLHEFIEAVLCKQRGITEAEVTAFDRRFEAMREQFPEVIGNEEPGDSPLAPYHEEHLVASSVERAMAEELPVPWESYEQAIYEL